MSKTYELCCPKHGNITIVVEKPPHVPRSVYCPWCLSKLVQVPESKQYEWQPNYSAAGVQS